MHRLVRPSLVAASVALAAGPLAAQGTTSGAFVVRLGKDTLAVERYTRTGSKIDGESVIRSPRTLMRSYTASFGSDGNLQHYEAAVWLPTEPPPPKAHPIQHVILEPGRDTATVTIHADSATTMHVAAGPGVLPIPNLNYGLWEAFVMRALKSGQDSLDVTGLFMGSPETNVVSIARKGRDSVLIYSPFGVARARIDAQGRILGLDSPGSTQQVVVERVPSVDIAKAGASFASRPLGQLSPRDTVRASLGGASVLVDYGRPAKRGRVIFGNVVPWDSVWRTGANAATTLVTDKALDVGGTTVPAGTYTLFSLPSQSGWKLIISKRTKEWGTEYDPMADLARIPMQASKLSSPVEQFTIRVEPQGDGGVLHLMWDDTDAAVPVKPKG